jgi:protein SCO1/2
MNRVSPIGLCFSLALHALSGHAEDTAPRSLFHLESSWVDDSGHPRQLRDLDGDVLLVVLFYTRCMASCPMTVKALQMLERHENSVIGAHTKLVLVTVDPERDTLDALRRYRLTMELDKKNWLLLRGSSTDVRKLAAVLGFNYEQIDSGEFAHSNLVTVLNRRGEIVHQQSGAGGDLEALSDAVRAAQSDSVPGGKGSRG